ncbi:hypothetical protein SSX86_006368 [Deinandra increscens subsp. villosa]|uniref:RRM domain-containing protein n=1 Tax=Deinandra increscens subsp. villosa TaxID=3103831 RepID=A0AAP0DF53_9ASTR
MLHHHRVSVVQGRISDGDEDLRPWEVAGARRQRNGGKQVYQPVGNQGRKVDDRWDNPEAWSTTIFVTNFPPTISVQGIKDTCLKVGRVIDVFMPNRLSLKGKRYAFLRFKKEVDAKEIISRVHSLWIGNYRLFADETRFKRDERKPPKHQQNTSAVGNTDVGNKEALSHGNMNANVGSYAQVTKGMGGVENRENMEKFEGEIFDDSLVMEEDFANSLLIKVRDFNVISKVYLHAHNEGFTDVNFRYVGGLWLRVDCPSKEVRDKFGECEAMNNIFQDIRRIDEEFCVTEKVIWVEVRGLPLVAWPNAVFRQIAWRWGKTLCVNNDREEPLAFGKVCILTSHVDKIRDSILYKVKGKVYKVDVTEVYAWTPSFEMINEDLSESDNEDLNDFEDQVSNDGCSLGSKTYDHLDKEEPKNVDSDPFKIMDTIRDLEREENVESFQDHV